MTEKRSRLDFEREMLPHIDAAYNLARWLLRHRQDAEDAVQQSYLKAFKAFDQFSGEYSIAWLLKIVRNTCFTFLRKKKQGAMIISIDAAKDSSEQYIYDEALLDMEQSPESDLHAQENKRKVWNGIHALSLEFREIIILREFEELNYQQISEIVEIPVGTVMSRLSRARKKLREELSATEAKGNENEL